MMATTRKDIEAALWRGANTFRGAIDAANYKDYILPMLFVKYLSDTYLEKVDNLKKAYENPVRLQRAIDRLPFVIKEKHSFDWLYDNRYSDNLGELINVALRGIEDDNPSLFAGVFRSIDFNSEAMLGNHKQKNTRLRELLEDFESLDLRPSSIQPEEGKVPADTIGDAYEYMIGEFAGQAGKKAGSFFTPSEVSELMARIVDPKISDTMYDPTCGSGSLLIKTGKTAQAKENNAIKKLTLYGQEMNGSSWSMAKMNMFLHDILDAKILWGDTLANPLHLDSDGNLMQFDVIVANMPFSQDKWAAGFNTGGAMNGKGKEFKMEASLDKYHRFDWGVPPASKGDWAFLLHMIASLKSGGRIAAVAPHGVLFRGASEGRIRQNVIEKNLLDAVIGLPANLFYGTSIPACIIVFKKNRNRDDVLFIDASGKDENGVLRYRKDKNQNRLEPKHIEDIVNAYKNRTDIDKFARVATLDEIKANGYNLNIPRYVDTFAEEALVDIEEVKTNIANIQKELAEVETQMAKYLKELGL
ncbi:putative type I restriction enzymeP M protein [Pelotomaculum schinkii]|uniref:site-specific DNA-methyltransferase (adenine-specific) n=1 Tax=Pelotomaculum schinkii TaxID=78350 RepID=A0A4Y7RG31_9FIRM|nr:type I restriction-modification system subunit M [Pelotomaculum schinkii]TEB07756.1 putative type I restriction enzymeP M protein [Pelotomaculum schinkii]